MICIDQKLGAINVEVMLRIYARVMRYKQGDSTRKTEKINLSEEEIQKGWEKILKEYHALKSNKKDSGDYL